MGNLERKINLYKICNMFILLVAVDKTKELKLQVHTHYYHPLFESPHSDHTFSPQIIYRIYRSTFFIPRLLQ